MQTLTRRAALRGIASISAISAPGTALAVCRLPIPAEPQTPEARIKAAVAEIAAAMHEMHPGWVVQGVIDDVHHVIRGRERGEPYSHAVLLYAFDGRHGMQRASWFRTYGDEVRSAIRRAL